MKKFITFVPMQRGKNLLCERYTAEDNPKLNMDREIHFPVIAIINGYIGDAKKFEVLAVMEEDNEDCLANIEVMKKEIDMVAKPKNAEYKLTPIFISKRENIDAHLKTMNALVDAIDDNDEIYACITFGTKPTPIIEMTAFNLVNKLKNNVTVECIAYGKINRIYNEAKSAYIYDVTSLFYMNSIIDNLDRLDVKKPIETIKTIIKQEDN